MRTALVLLAVLALVACGKKEEKPFITLTSAAASAPTVTEEPSKEQALSAMLRGHPNSRQVCIDDHRENSFFLNYGPLLSSGAPGDGQWHGWIMIWNVEFYKTSNNTWFVLDMNGDRYIQAYPDVTSLQCKAQ